MNLKMTTEYESRNPNPNEGGKRQSIDLGKGSEVVLITRFLAFDESWKWFDYLNKEIPWTRPTIRVFGRSCVQVHKAFPGSHFNSLLLNRYKGGNDYVGWHADDEKLYGSTPEIASVSLGCDREFLLKKKPSKMSQDKRVEGEPPRKRSKKNNHSDQHSFTLKHGSLLLMRGHTQRDWVHSVPRRAKAEATRINLTFRRVV
ncbi:DNA oxidative demethylase ALKBH2 isoform X2 [Actinidia eriantha]|uniref:DNA oxidative demethylase ALKBH2 isoform X2 n=1 Tax=Actinidia eriantha TaxID=165200 RepID=UPI00258575B1|nr:DNA oxidative demethylase ALKBH2 isoform X2 [Actinidia eriantha]